MAVDRRRDPETCKGAAARVGEQLGINPETLRNWVTQAEVDAGDRPGTTTSDAKRLAELEKENREPQRANAILRGAPALFAAEFDRPQRFVEYIDAPKEAFGVEMLLTGSARRRFRR